jgi:hypothetical protein
LLQNPRTDPSVDTNLAIRWAAREGYVDIVQRLLLDPRVDPTAGENAALTDAASFGHADVVRLLLQDRRLDPALMVESLVGASVNGQTETVRLLLADERVDPGGDENSAMRFACQNGHAGVVQLLLPRVDPRFRNSIAILKACYYGHDAVVKLLLEDGRADPAARGNKAISVASYKGHIEVVKLLLADGRVNPSANNNEAVGEAEKHLHWRREKHKYEEIIKLLIADPRVPKSRPNTFISRKPGLLNVPNQFKYLPKLRYSVKAYANAGAGDSPYQDIEVTDKVTGKICAFSSLLKFNEEGIYISEEVKVEQDTFEDLQECKRIYGGEGWVDATVLYVEYLDEDDRVVTVTASYTI